MFTPQSQSAEPARGGRTLAALQAIINDLIGADATQSGPDTTFIEMGADSLLLLQVSQAIQAKFGVKVPFRLLFEELATVEAVAAHVDSQLPAEAALQPDVERASPTGRPNGSSGSAVRPITVEDHSPKLAAAGGITAYTPVLEQFNSHSSGNGLESIFALQLQIMAHQLNMLANGHTREGGASLLPFAPAPEQERTLPELPLSRETKGEAQGHSQAGRANGFVDPEPYVAYKPIQRERARGLLPRQQRHLEELIERLSERTQGSKQITQQYRYHLADSSASSGFRSLWKELCYPIAVERAQGSRVWDVDGNQYVDITMGFGSLLFGHSPSFIFEAIGEQLSRGFQIGWKTEIAGKLAELVCEMTGVERVAFCNSGTEAVMSALRLARAVTGRTKIVVFAGSFHGTFDGVLIKAARGADGGLQAAPMAPGVPVHMIEDVLVLTHSDPRSLEVIKENIHEVAAVLIEPSPSRRPDLQTKEFLQELRRLTAEGGAALIFDEVIIGFRMHPGGGQALFDVKADIVTYGKALGSGVPIGAVAGKAAFLDAIDGGVWNYGDSSLPQAETTYYAGTFFKHPVVMAAAYATLKKLKEGGPELQGDLNRRTAQFAEGLNDFFAQADLPIRVGHFGSLFRFFYPKDLQFMDLFFFHLIEKGVWVSETRVCFVSTTTADEDLAHVARAVKESVTELREAGFLPSTAPELATRLEPMTEAQKGLWALSQLSSEVSGAHNESMVVRLRGKLDIAALRWALQQVVDRHEALRTTFSEDGGYQKIAPSVRIETPLIDFTTQGVGGPGNAIDRWLTTEIKEPFDMLAGPLLRSHVARVGNEEHLLVLVIHHIVTDAWSFDRLLGEIGELYKAEYFGVRCDLPQAVPFSEYVRQKSGDQAGHNNGIDEEYWLRRFAGTISDLELPTDRPRPRLQTYNGALDRLKLDRGLCRDLKELSARRGCTFFMTLLAGFKTLLHYLTGLSDIVVGTHSAGQASIGGANLVGFCINMLALRTWIRGDQTFEEILDSVKRGVLEAYRHQEYPIGRLIKKLKLVRNPSRPPLVSVVFNMDWAMSIGSFDSSLKDAGLEMEIVEPPVAFARFDLLWNLVDDGDGLVLDCTYNTDLFNGETIREWIRAYEKLLQRIVSQPAIRIAELGNTLAALRTSLGQV